MKTKYDIIYGSDIQGEEIGIEPHCCRDYPCDETHGCTWEQAKKEVLKYYKKQYKHYKKEWKNKKKKDYFSR